MKRKWRKRKSQTDMKRRKGNQRNRKRKKNAGTIPTRSASLETDVKMNIENHVKKQLRTDIALTKIVDLDTQ